MSESRLRQIWAGLMPSFPEPDALLHISDPDDRAVTMLLKTLYVVFKGVLEERHQLSCCEHRTSSAKPRTPDASGTRPRPASVEEIDPSSPGDLVPPSPANATHLSQTGRTISASASSHRPAVLAPETVDIRSSLRPDRLPRPVAETVPPPRALDAIWVPETLETSPLKAAHRPRPVPETVPPPSTPPRVLKQSEAVSPLLPGRTTASRRARRTANRSGTVSSPAPPPPPWQGTPQQGATATAETTSAAAAANGATTAAAQATTPTAAVASPTPSLGSPLLLPQHPPGRHRHPAVPETITAEPQKGSTDKSTASSSRRTSRLSRAKPSQAEGDQISALPQDGLDETNFSQSPPAKKKKYVFIGPDDPVPPRKAKGTASPRKNIQQEPCVSEIPPGLASQPRPPKEAASRFGASALAKTTVTATPTKTVAQSIFELSPASDAAQTRSSINGQTSPAGKRTNSKRKPTPKKSTEERGRSATAGARGDSSQSAESVVGLDVLLEEIDCEGAQTQAQREVLAPVQAQDGGQGGGPSDGQHQDHTAHENNLEPAGQLEHESQDETQMDSLVFAQPAAGPSFRYDAGPVRRKADRQKLPGWSCDLCKEWYADRDMTEEELRAHMNRCSRHRQKEPPAPATPPGFWDPVGFPSMNVTQYGSGGPRTRARRKL